MNDPLARFKLRFGTADHELDAVTYAQMLITTSILIDESANELETGTSLELKVVAENKGSYESELYILAGAAIGTASMYVTPANIAAAKVFGSKVLELVSKCWELKKWLKGEQAKSVDAKDGSVVIGGDNSGSITVNQNVYNVFLQDRTQETMKAGMSSLEANRDISEFEILSDENKVLFHAERGDFPQLAKKISPVPEKKRKRRRRSVLSVVRQSFERNRKSDFVWAGRTISAFIESEEFWRRIDLGERFAKGDKLLTTLEVEEVYNNAVRAWAHKSYKVIEVLEHRPRQGQPNLFESGSYEQLEALSKRKPKRLLG